MLRNLPFRSRLMLVVSLPMIVVLGFAGFAIKDRFDALGAEQQYGELIGPFQALTQVARTVGDEGVASQWYLRAPESAQARLAQTRAASDQAVNAFEMMRRDLPGNLSQRTVDTIHDVTTALDDLVAVRGEVDARHDDANTATFHDTAADALTAAAAVDRDLDDQTLANSLGGVVDLRREQLAAADEGALVISHVTGGSPDVDEWLQAITEQNARRRLFEESASANESAAFANLGIDDIQGDLVRDEAGLALPRSFDGLTATPHSYADWYRDKQTSLDNGVAAVQSVITTEASNRESSARGVLLVVALGTAAVIWAVLMLVWALVRSVTGSLRALMRGARELSERRLPLLVDTLRRGGDLESESLDEFTPIRIDSKDELGDLAKAFNTTQEVTITVAREQSEFLKKGIGDLYVNLARRNQSLLDRQIALLDDLESNADPDELGSLFELDHLATRMRRNAESLLVLSGAEQPRHWGATVPIVDVVRAAAAEIADFARLHAYGFDGDLAITGNAVSDLTHLLAELLENATAFSPPGTPVSVVGRKLEQRFVISITDEGIGMDDARLAAANALLARPPATGLALSRTLGLHDVGHLAERHNIRVQLRRAEPCGVAALVVLPADLLATTPADGAAPDRPTTSEYTPSDPVAAEIVTDTPAEAPAAETTRAPVTPLPVREPEPVAWDRPRDDAETETDTPEPATVGAGAEPFPRRVPGASGAGEHANGNGHGNGNAGHGLTTRVPGASLTHVPSDPPATNGDVRPRPERVHDLLSRHERGKRAGHGRGEE